MKRLIVLAMIMAVILLVAALVHAQTPAIDLKPTFISPTPGLYVNGWPAFTVSYPKEWEVMPPYARSLFSVGVPRPDLPMGYYLPTLTVAAFPSPLPLEDWAKMFMPIWVEIATDIKVLSDKPSRLKDGTPAREVEVEFVYKSGPKATGLLLATKKDEDPIWVALSLADDKGKPVEYLKRIAYSLTFQPGREKPVNVPPDVRAFLDMFCVDIVSGDVKAIMEHYSDRYLNSGASKAFAEQFWLNDPMSPINRGLISQDATVTVFEPHGDKAYIDGFWLRKTKGNATTLNAPMSYQQIINEHGQWKWYGNQK
jgi:hypothetical protein